MADMSEGQSRSCTEGTDLGVDRVPTHRRRDACEPFTTTTRDDDDHPEFLAQECSRVSLFLHLFFHPSPCRNLGPRTAEGLSGLDHHVPVNDAQIEGRGMFSSILQGNNRGNVR